MARNRKRAAKKDPWADEDLLFGAKSKLIDVDLEKYFADPEAWAILDESEKAQLRTLLPSHIVLNEDGSIPQDFLKYDPDWRNALRQFQVDLEAGRYDADWLEEAAQAMEERAAGDFDDFKEREYEEFWGQKQKLSHNVIAGDMTTLKLEVLVRAGIYKVGDVWSFSRTIGRGKQGVTVEKDVPIIAVDNGKLTFTIPPGQSKYLVMNEVGGEDTTNGVENLVQTLETTKAPMNKLDDSIEKVNLEVGPAEPVERLNDRQVNRRETKRDIDRGENEDLTGFDADDSTLKGKDAISGGVQSCSADRKHIKPTESKTPPKVQETPGITSPPNRRVTRSQNRVSETLVAPKASDSPKPITAPKRPHTDTDPNPPPNPHDPNKPITITITHPSALGTKILEVDGRIQPSGKYNAWKAIRCKRDEQDMGSLWEMREEYYVHRLAM